MSRTEISVSKIQTIPTIRRIHTKVNKKLNTLLLRLHNTHTLLLQTRLLLLQIIITRVSSTKNYYLLQQQQQTTEV